MNKVTLDKTKLYKSHYNGAYYQTSQLRRITLCKMLLKQASEANSTKLFNGLKKTLCDYLILAYMIGGQDDLFKDNKVLFVWTLRSEILFFHLFRISTNFV